MTLSDAGVSNDDASYTGDTGDSATSLQYYRNKAAEFQTVLIAMDSAASAARTVLSLNIDDDIEAQRIQDRLDEFDQKKYLFRAAAEGINAAAAVINATGGRFAPLSIPSGLGNVGALIPIAAIIATAVTLISWAQTWIKSLDLPRTLAGISDPAKRDIAAAAAAQSLAAGQAVQDSPMTSLSSIFKWAALAGVAYFAYRAYLSNSGGD
jgi:hypothetical protein